MAFQIIQELCYKINFSWEEKEDTWHINAQSTIGAMMDLDIIINNKWRYTR